MLWEGVEWVYRKEGIKDAGAERIYATEVFIGGGMD
jgi:hypothetical protein